MSITELLEKCSNLKVTDHNTFKPTVTFEYENRRFRVKIVDTERWYKTFLSAKDNWFSFWTVIPITSTEEDILFNFARKMAMEAEAERLKTIRRRWLP